MLNFTISKDNLHEIFTETTGAAYVRFESNFNGVSVVMYYDYEDGEFSNQEVGFFSANVISHGEIILSTSDIEKLFEDPDFSPRDFFEFVDYGEKAEICTDSRKIYVFQTVSKSYIAEKEEEAKREQARKEHQIDALYPPVEKCEKVTETEIDFSEVLKTCVRIDPKKSTVFFHEGTLFVSTLGGCSIRGVGGFNLTTANFSYIIKDLRKTKGEKTLVQYPDGRATFDGHDEPFFTRPKRQYSPVNKILALYDPESMYFIPAYKINLQGLKAADKFTIIDREKGLAFCLQVGPLRRALKAYKEPQVAFCKCENMKYIVIGEEGCETFGAAQENFDILVSYAKPEGPCINRQIVLNVFKSDYENKQEETPKKAPTLDASTPASADTTPAEKAPEKQAEGPLQGELEKQGEKQEEKAPEKPEQPEPVKSTEKELEPEKKPSRAEQTSAADEPSRAEKPFEIGTYTTKKGKVKTAVKFNVTPRPEWIEALKTAFYWEYNGTWNGSPRKLPEIFKH